LKGARLSSTCCESACRIDASTYYDGPFTLSLFIEADKIPPAPDPRELPIWSAHHVRFAQSRALGRKVSDEFTVPLCRGHHREVHRCGDKPVWWLKVRINPMVKARDLWLKTHSEVVH
jgi:hypothetical protein